MYKAAEPPEQQWALYVQGKLESGTENQPYLGFTHCVTSPTVASSKPPDVHFLRNTCDAALYMWLGPPYSKQGYQGRSAPLGKPPMQYGVPKVFESKSRLLDLHFSNAVDRLLGIHLQQSVAHRKLYSLAKLYA